jgi:steroid 5-alpha reductase family enzyme
MAVLVAWAASDGGVTAGGLPAVLSCLLLAFGINWVAFVHSWLAKTEKYYDLTGTATYLSVVLLALVLVGRYDARSLLLVGLVAVWTLRLGVFLFRRILASGSDSRFEEILTNPAQLFMTWTLQGLWVSLTLAAALAAITTEVAIDLGWWWIPGTILWVAGMTFEVTADAQKSAFKADPANEGAYISTGVWAWSRHPNYFGEMTLWVGIALISVPVLQGWSYVALVSPVFVYVLLRYISGVPLLERKARRRWGDDPQWRAYQRDTPLLFPRPPRSGSNAEGASRP